MTRSSSLAIQGYPIEPKARKGLDLYHLQENIKQLLDAGLYAVKTSFKKSSC